MSFLIILPSLTFLALAPADPKRNILNASRFSFNNLVRSGNVFDFISFIFILYAAYDFCLYWKLGTSFSQCFMSQLRFNTVDFKHYSSWFNFGNETNWITFTLSHLYFRWLLGEWMVWKYSYPNLTGLRSIS